ncbi:MAG: MBL fold metallo-hydrolase [Bacillota bacterium]
MELRITVLVNNTVYLSNFKAEHGWSVLIETAEGTLLFDTGQSGLFLENARFMKLELEKVDKVVLSHGHYDHTGGLEHLLKLNPGIKIYAHPDASQKRFYFQPGKPAREIGMPEGVRPFKENFCFARESKEIIPGCFTTGEITRVFKSEETIKGFFLDPQGKTPDYVCDDQALIVRTSVGPVVILGCCHSGLENTLEQVAELTGTRSFPLVLGGMHLSNVSENYINRAAEALQRFSIQKIGVAHCTGYYGAIKLEQLFFGEIMECNVGSIFEL